MSLSLQRLVGIKACQGLFPNITFKSPGQTVRHTLEKLTLAPSGLLTNAHFLDPEALDQPWPTQTHLYQCWSEDGPVLATLAHRASDRREATAPGLAPQQDPGAPASRLQLCWLPHVQPCQRHNGLHSLKTPTPPSIWRRQLRSFDHFNDKSSIFWNIHFMLKASEMSTLRVELLAGNINRKFN